MCMYVCIHICMCVGISEYMCVHVTVCLRDKGKTEKEKKIFPLKHSQICLCNSFISTSENHQTHHKLLWSKIQ